MSAVWFARLEAQPGSEEKVERLLAEHATTVDPSGGAWWVLRFGAGELAVCTTLGADALPDLAEHAGLLDGDVIVDEAEVLVEKLQPLRMATKALVLRLPVKASADDDATSLLRSAVTIVERELETVAWFAFRYRDGDLGVLSAFPDRHSRRAHLNGRFAREVGKKVFCMLDGFPAIELADVIEQRRPKRR